MDISCVKIFEWVFNIIFFEKKIKNPNFVENFEKKIFSAKRKATSLKLGKHVKHDVKYAPVNLQPSCIKTTARKKLKPLSLPTQLLHDRAMN